MLLLILNIVAPVFLLLLAGYCSVKFNLLSATTVDGVMGFAIRVAVPCLLFLASSSIDLSAVFDWRLIFAYYGVATFMFASAYVITRRYYQRRPGEAVAVSVAGLFSNLILLGTPIADRAFGADGQAIVIALLSVNVPICYTIGICCMESLRADGRSWQETSVEIIRTLSKNSLMIGILLGFAVNLSGFTLPALLLDVLVMLKSAAIPCALFALGGILTRYSLSEELSEASVHTFFSLLLQPTITYAVCTLLGLEGLNRTVVVCMSAMPVGLNAPIFASHYSRGVSTAASTVLLSTVVSLFSVSFWLWLLVDKT